MPDGQDLNLPFPEKGTDRATEFERPPAYTTVRGLNVRLCDPFSRRDRGGSRYGLNRYLLNRVAGGVAIGDAYTATSLPLTVAAPGVLANDTVPAGFGAVVVVQPAWGTVVMTPDGGFTYTADVAPAPLPPPVPYTDHFRYRLQDSDSDFGATGTVTVTVSGTSPPPPPPPPPPGTTSDRITEPGDTRQTEAGDTRETET